MRHKHFITLLILLTGYFTHAQDVGGKTLVSQSRTTSTNIGQCDITIKYHSPSVNGRKIFGGIVPYDFVVDGVEYPWRAGSNARTTIEFSHDVEIQGQPLVAGSYGFLVLVSETEWTLIFSSGKTWGAFNYDKKNDVLRIPVKVEKVPFQEWLSYEFRNPKNESVDIQLRWEAAAVTFNVSTNALDNTLVDLEKKTDKNPGDFQNLAIRTLEKNPGDLPKAMDYLERSKEAIENLDEDRRKQAYNFNYKMLKSSYLLQQGKKKEAKVLKEEALDSAGGFNLYYFALNKYLVEGKKKEAYQILNSAISRYPDNFQNHFAFGEYYLKEGNQEKATDHFKKAYEMTVEQESRWKNYARYLYLQNQLVLDSQMTK
ncbi:MAG: DUF2911 domain-containing protein [Bacteroidota bacterium]